MPGTILSTLYHVYEVGTIIVPIKKKKTQRTERLKNFSQATQL